MYQHGDRIDPIDYAKWPFLVMQVHKETAAVYDTVKLASAPNYIGARIQLETGLNLDIWNREATSHPDDHIVLEGIAYGFPLQYTGGPKFSSNFAGNHLSVVTS